MKKAFLLMSLLTMFTGMFAKSAALCDRVEPANWFVGMKHTQLQIMLHGTGIREANVTTNYAGVRIDSLVRLDSPNYLLVYVDLKDAKAGTMPLTVQLKGKKQVINYPLLNREMAGDKRYGFTNADVLYMLMPDRFAQGKSELQPKDYNLKTKYTVDRNAPSLRHGGNLAGIAEHLDYFTDLGVTTLWFTPVLENDSPDNGGSSTYHGYATTNYYRIDPRFGSNAEYKALIDSCHQRGLKVVMDMIFNHCVFEHPWVADRPSKDWFNCPDWLDAPKDVPLAAIPGQSTTYAGAINKLYEQTSYKLTPTVDPYASKIDLHECCDGWFVPSMPDLNQRNPHLMRYLIQNSKWWIETVGIDGIRMDTYPYADFDGMASWMKEINEEYPNYNVVGESWVTEPAFTAALQKDSRLTTRNSYLNTVMDFTFFDRMQAAKYDETDAWWNGFNKVYNAFVYDYLYTDPTHVMAFLDNHDTDRFLADTKDMAKLKQGLALLLTINRIPQIYYGTEIMMNGTKRVTDGDVRKDFPGGFPGDKKNAFSGDNMTPEECSMFGWLSRLLHWRQGNEVIIKGSMTQFIPKNGIYAIARQYQGHSVLTIVNGLDKENTIDMQRYKELYGEKHRALDMGTGDIIQLEGSLTIPARGTLILEF